MSTFPELILDQSCLPSCNHLIPERIQVIESKIILGKGAPKIKVDITLPGLSFISRKHAEIDLTDSDCVITDLNSCNGTFVNNVRIDSTKLQDGDIVQFGGSKNTCIGETLINSDIACLKYIFRSGKRRKNNQNMVNKESKKRKVDSDDESWHSDSVPQLNRSTTGIQNKIVSNSNSNLSDINNIIPARDNEIFALQEELTQLKKSYNNMKTQLKMQNETVAEPLTRIQMLTTNNNRLNSIINEQKTHEKELNKLLLTIVKDIQTQKICTEKFSNETVAMNTLSHTVNNNSSSSGSKHNTIQQTINTLNINIQHLYNEYNRRITEMQVQISSQADTIELLGQEKEELYRKHNEHTTQLQLQVKQLQEEVRKIDRKNNILSSNTGSSNTKERASIPTTTTTTSSITDIANENLRNNLQCTLCEKLLIDAVVLPCSHGFCRACIETHWHPSSGFNSNNTSNNYSSSTSSSGRSSCSACRCPTCNISATSPLTVYTRQARTQSREGYYIHSDHLDNLIWFVREGSAPALHQSDKQREEKNRNVLRRIGIDPDLPLHSTVEEEEEEENASSKNYQKYSTGTSTTTATATAAVSMINNISNIGGIRGMTNKNPSNLNTTTKGNKEVQQEKKEEVLCEYCGENGHKETACPHRLYEYNSDNNCDDSNIEEEEDY